MHRFGVRQVTDRPAPTLDMKQLELIVQWQNHTFKFFTRAPGTEHIWQTLIVEEALRTPMLMHAILGVSALHIALSRGVEERPFWVDLATAHCGEALQSFMNELFQINPANAKAMLGSSGFVVAYAFGVAVATMSDAEKPSLDGLVNVFLLCCGVHDIINVTHVDLKQSNFAPLFMVSPPAAVVPDHVQESLDGLEAMNHTALTSNPEHDFATYQKAIGILKTLSAQTYSPSVCMSLAAEMPIRCQRPYVDRIQKREPFALIVLAHYCALLHIHQNPFIQPWGAYVLRDICTFLDDDWKARIKWPIRQVFGGGDV